MSGNKISKLCYKILSFEIQLINWYYCSVKPSSNDMSWLFSSLFSRLFSRHFSWHFSRRFSWLFYRLSATFFSTFLPTFFGRSLAAKWSGERNMAEGSAEVDCSKLVIIGIRRENLSYRIMISSRILFQETNKYWKVTILKLLSSFFSFTIFINIH